MLSLDLSSLALLDTYLYFLGCLLLLPFLAAGFVFAPLSRKVAVASGLGVVPTAPLAAHLQNTYWTPIRVGGGAWGIEDALFGFAAGAIVWWAATWPISRRIRLDFSWKRIVVYFSIVHLIGMSIFTFAMILNADAMMTLLFIHIAFSVYFYVRVPEYRVAQATGLALFVGFYAAYFCIVIAVTDNAYAAWESMGFWGVRVWSLPIGEWLWACAFATSHPVLVAHCSRARILAKPAN